MPDQLTPEVVAFDAPNSADARRLSAFLQGQQPPERFRPEKENIHEWKLVQNDAGPGFASAMVLRGTDEIVSLCTVTPKRFWNGGAEQSWGEIGDTFTRPDFLRRGMFAALVTATRERTQAAGVSIVYGLPNAASLPGYVNKLGFPVKANLSLDTHAAVLSSRAAARRLASGPLSVLAPLARQSSTVRSSRALARTLLLSRIANDPTVHTERVTDVAEEFDGLWLDVRERLPVAQIRDRRYLAWRFIASPFAFNVWTARRGDKLKGYMVTVESREGGADGYRHQQIVDWLHGGGDSSVPSALLRAVIRDSEADLLSVMGARTSPLRLDLPSLFRRQPIELPLIIHANEAGKALGSDSRPWHFTLADTDAF